MAVQGTMLVRCALTALLLAHAAAVKASSSTPAVMANSRRHLKAASAVQGNPFLDALTTVAKEVVAPGPIEEKPKQVLQALQGAFSDAAQRASTSDKPAECIAGAAATAATTVVATLATAARAPAPPGDKAVNIILGTVAGVGQVTTAALDAAHPPAPAGNAPSSAVQKAAALFKQATTAISSTRACLECHRTCRERGGTPQGSQLCTKPADVVASCDCATPAVAPAAESAAVAAAG